MLCAGPHQVRELRRAEKLYGTKRKNLVECGYDLLDREIAEYELAAAAVERDPSRRDVVLIAPVVAGGPASSTPASTIC